MLKSSRIFLTIVLSCLFASFAANAQSANREESIRNARVWDRPAWIDANFAFDPKLNITDGPELSKTQELLMRSPVACTMTPELAAKDMNGDTRKFVCQMQVPGVPALDVKFKYFFEAGEVPAEVMGTRLLWALGFAADRMFFIKKLDCYGCTEDPFHDRRVEPRTLKTPQRFTRVAAENKFAGKEIDGGWTFDELMNNRPENSKDASAALAEREALRLLAVFIRYADNKADNQRLVCMGKKTSDGGCNGKTVMMLQDLGVSFAQGLIPGGPMTNVDYPEWDQSPIWANPAECLAAFGDNNGGESWEPAIHESGRLFLVKLLRGFSAGTVGRKRVEQLFALADADTRGGTVSQWADTFQRKIDELEYPLGKSHKDFRCPKISGAAF